MAAKRSDSAATKIRTDSNRANERLASSPHLSVVANTEEAGGRQRASSTGTAPSHPLSVRAENVLKILALELTGENPPRGRWTPSDLLLQMLTYKHLSTARNCGPQTTAEIVRWAATRGRLLRRSLHAGRSLSAMWQDTISRFLTGDISKAEVAEALESSTRRRNTRIPVALQEILLELLRPPTE
jgi:hypothetical protein